MRNVFLVDPEANRIDWAALGCTVVGEAANAEEGLKLAKRLKPDLIVTEIDLPDTDGLSMIERLRAEGLSCPVIVHTAQTEFSRVQRALRLGVFDYLVKPTSFDEWKQAIDRLNARGTEPDGNRLPALGIELVGKSRYVQEAIGYIAAHYGNPALTVGEIANDLHISEGHLSHVFRRETGFTLVEYLAQYRIREAARLLRDVRMKIYEVAQAVGYRDFAYFSGAFRRFMGQTPTEYQKNMED